MKAAVCNRYGPPEVLQIGERPMPKPGDNEILVRNHASAVNSADWRLRKPNPWAVRLFFGFMRPRNPVLGGVFAGVVEAVGSKVTRFAPGDHVMGLNGMRMGCYAQHVCVKANGALTKINKDIAFSEAAATPFGASAAMHFLRKAPIQQGTSVMIYGASGSLGTAAIQIAVMAGARVTAVCSKGNAELVRALGAAEAIDHADPEFSRHAVQYDVLFETVNKLPFKHCLRLLKPKGTLLMASAGVQETLAGSWVHAGGRYRVVSGLAPERGVDMEEMAVWLAEKKFRPAIDRIYPLEQIADAHRYVEAGHKKGNVVITIP